MDTYKQQEKKNEINFVVMMIILFALIIIIFLLVRSFGFVSHKPLVPTGNVDIFDITFNSNCNCCNNNCSCNNNDNANTSTNNKDNNYNDFNPASVEVFDEDTEYSDNTPLNIFTNTSYYVVEDKIAPTSTNSYQFVIRNHNNFNIAYDLEISETNEYKINMKYRLKLNGNYVVGSDKEWVSYNDLNQYDIGLSSNNYDVYTLDWKWFESENDTAIGTNVNSKYKLNLKITASGY